MPIPNSASSQTVSSKRSEYRPRRDRCLFGIVLGSILLAIGVASLYGVGPHFPLILALLIFDVLPGGFALFFSSVALTIDVTVDDHGLRKSPRWHDGFEIAWGEIESWSVSPVTKFQGGDSFTFRVARFRVRGRRQPVAVFDSAAWRPGFDAFLEDVRAHARETEAA